MERAAAEEKARKAALKRPPSVSTDESKADPKRQKVDHTTPPAAAHAASILSAFDFTSLPAALITELVVANLQAFSEDAFTTIVQAYKASSPMVPAPVPAVMPAATPVAGPSILPPMTSTATDSEHASKKPEAAVVDEGKEDRILSIVKDEPVDPLQMDIDQDELEYEPDKLNLEVCSFGRLSNSH